MTDPQHQQHNATNASSPAPLGYESGRDRLQRSPPSIWVLVFAVFLGVIAGILCVAAVASMAFGTGGLRLSYISNGHAMAVICLFLTAVAIFSLVQIVRKPGWRRTSQWSVAGILIGVGFVLLMAGICAVVNGK